MRIFTVAMLVLCGCGSWSNEDLLYAQALPRSEDLKSQLSTPSQQPLSVGDPSKTYDETKKGSDNFNTVLDGILSGLDGIRKIVPSKREENKRTWGPYADDKHPGFDVKVEITRLEEKKYAWSIQMRPRLGEFFEIGGGEFTQTTETLRQGTGNFHFEGKVAREKLMEEGKPDDPDKITFKYETDRDPVRVNIEFEFPMSVTAAYAFNGFVDTSAVLQWIATDPANLNATKVSYLAGWDTKTAGRADFVILQGNWAPAMGTECWDPGHIIVYAKGYEDAGPFEVGDMSKCVAIPTLNPIE